MVPELVAVTQEEAVVLAVGLAASGLAAVSVVAAVPSEETRASAVASVVALTAQEDAADSEEAEGMEVSKEGLVAVEAEVVVDLADKEEVVVMVEMLVVVMVEMLVLEVGAQEAAVTEVALELGLVNQEVVDMAAEVADTVAGSVDIQGA